MRTLESEIAGRPHGPDLDEKHSPHPLPRGCDSETIAVREERRQRECGGAVRSGRTQLKGCARPRGGGDARTWGPAEGVLSQAVTRRPHAGVRVGRAQADGLLGCQVPAENAAYRSMSLSRGVCRLLTVYSSPLVRVSSQRWLLRGLILRTLSRLTRTLRWIR